MSLICNKSYSESKIRGMIASVVYGHNLPDRSSENGLTMATTKSSRRPSRKVEEPILNVEGLHLRDDDREYSMEEDHPASYEEMNIHDGHPHPVDDRLTPSGGESVRRSSIQSQYRLSVSGEESPMVDYDDPAASVPPSNHLQVPGTPPLESEDSRLGRSYPLYRHQSLTPTGPPISNSLNAAVIRQERKLRHSHSHPNIGQQRQQQYLEQQEANSRYGYSAQNPPYPAQQHRQPYLQRQALRRESAQYHSSSSGYPRPEISVERRFSHPAALQPSSPSSSRFLPHPGDTHSPALSSSRSSPGRESLHSVSGQPNTPQVGSLPGLNGRYEAFTRRMSQPQPTTQRPYYQLPPLPPGAPFHPYDRRVSDVEEYGYQHREKYEKLSASTMRISSNSKMFVPPPLTSHPEPRSLHPSPANANGGHGPSQRHAYQHLQDSTSSVYYQHPTREDMDADGLSSEETEDRPFARMRQSYKRPPTGRSLSRMGSHPNLYTTATTTTMAGSNAGVRELDSAMPRNNIKPTCFPNGALTDKTTDPSPCTTTSMTMDTTDARAVQLCQGSKVVIEITQPRPLLQAFEPLCSVQKPFPETEDVPRPLLLTQQKGRSLRHTVSQPNLMMMMMTRSTSSVLGRRRSVSPPDDDMAFGSSKKRRSDSVSGSVKEDDDETTTGAAGINLLTPASASASAVVAAAVNAARQQQQQQESCTGNRSGLQIVGMEYEDKKMDMMTSNSKDIGLGVRVPSETGGMVESPTIEALSVAKASSYAPLEEQKELGIDYSLFTLRGGGS